MPTTCPDRLVAACAHSQILTCGADTFVKIFDPDNLSAEPRTIEHHDSPVTTLAIKRSGKNIVTGTEAHMVQYFGYPSCTFEKNITRAQSPIQAVAFDPKGKFVAVGGDDGVIRMCMTSMPQYTNLKSHSDAILTLAFDPKGEFLASSSADGTVKIWDITDEATVVKTVRITTKVTPGGSQRLRIAWHPTGSHLAVPYSNGVHILERTNWTASAMLVNAHTKEVTHVGYSPNGQYLATCGLDRQVYVWQGTTQESLDRHKNDIVCADLAWSPRDNALAFLDEAGQLHLWHQPVPGHLPSPAGDPSAVAEQAAAAADKAAADKADLLTKAAATAASVPAEAAAAPAKSAGKSVFSFGDDDDDMLIDDAVAKAKGAGNADDAEVGASGGAAPKRRLRKVQHDSDDGGFSDHDDDEAAEAAMLAKELAKRGAGGAATAVASVVSGLGGAAAGKASLGALAALASAPAGVAAQGVVHSSATPAKNGRRFLLWNLTGMVLSRDENVFSAIEVEFNSIEKHRPIRLTDHYSFSMAALTEEAVMFASTSNNGNPSTIVYRPLASWAPNSEWQVQLDKGEEATAVALGHKFAAIATNKRYLRILSHTGAQRALVCIPGNLVALAAHGGYLAVAMHAGRAADANDQAVTLALYDLRESARPVKIASVPLPLSEGATLDWIGFSESATLCTVDSAGIVRGCMKSYQYEWVPLLDCSSVKKVHHTRNLHPASPHTAYTTHITHNTANITHHTASTPTGRRWPCRLPPPPPVAPRDLTAHLHPPGFGATRTRDRRRMSTTGLWASRTRSSSACCARARRPFPPPSRGL